MNENVVRVRYNGQSYSPGFNELDIGILSSNEDVLSAVARYLDVQPEKLRSFFVEKLENGDFSVHPQAAFAS